MTSRFARYLRCLVVLAIVQGGACSERSRSKELPEEPIVELKAADDLAAHVG